MILDCDLTSFAEGLPFESNGELAISPWSLKGSSKSWSTSSSRLVNPVAKDWQDRKLEPNEASEAVVGRLALSSKLLLDSTSHRLEERMMLSTSPSILSAGVEGREYGVGEVRDTSMDGSGVLAS